MLLFFFVGSLHEARQKANKAQFFTDLSSGNEDNNCRKNLTSVKSKRIPSPPTFVISKLCFLILNIYKTMINIFNSKFN